MQAGYINNWNYYPALTATYAAKKVAETAPGVGTNTDIHFIGRLGWMRLWKEHFDAVEKMYTGFREKQSKLMIESVQKLAENCMKAANDQAQQQGAGKDAQTDAGAGSNATEAARANEAGGEEGQEGRE
jgi:uncharacterized protein (DUF305 family)